METLALGKRESGLETDSRFIASEYVPGGQARGARTKALPVLQRITEVMKIMASRRGVGAPWSLLLSSVVTVDVFDDGCL